MFLFTPVAIEPLVHVALPLFPTAEICGCYLGPRLMDWTLLITMVRDRESPGESQTSNYKLQPRGILLTTHLLELHTWKAKEICGE